MMFSLNSCEEVTNCFFKFTCHIVKNICIGYDNFWHNLNLWNVTLLPFLMQVIFVH